jgi:hypothetical protein
MNSWEFERVRRHTSRRTNARIDADIAGTIEAFSAKTEGAITQRIDQLDQEWDIERILETNASTLALLGVGLAATVNRKWLALSAGVLSFLLLHGVHGWCPPLPALRRAGVRTRAEIDRERFALKFLRGDFDQVRRPTGEINLTELVRAMAI